MKQNENSTKFPKRRTGNLFRAIRELYARIGAVSGTVTPPLINASTVVAHGINQPGEPHAGGARQQPAKRFRQRGVIPNQFVAAGPKPIPHGVAFCDKIVDNGAGALSEQRGTTARALIFCWNEA